MSFFSNIFSATVKAALTPVAVVKDVVNVVIGDEVDATKNLIEDAGDDIKQAGDDLADGEMI